MKWVVLAAALLLPSTASAKMWVDQTCGHIVISTDGTFFYEGGGGEIVTCKIEDWPITRANATLGCADGSEVNAEWPDDYRLLWNGTELNVYDGPLPCGAGGAEWPD